MYKMNLLKLAFLFPFIFLSFTYKNGEKKTTQIKAKQVLILHAELSKEAYFQLPKIKKDSVADSVKVYYIKTSLTNTTDETIYFLGVSCSYEDMFVVKQTELFKLHPSSKCSKNTPTLISLKSKETYTNEIAIRPIVKESLIPLSTEIGFEFIEYKIGEDFDVIESYQARHSAGTKIWSNSFSLKND